MSDEDDCLERARELLSFLPSSNFKTNKRSFTNDPVIARIQNLKDFVPVNSKKPYDMKELITEVVDDKHFLRSSKRFC
jgi:propionyl-CoA carboxylase beta chain